MKKYTITITLTSDLPPFSIEKAIRDNLMADFEILAKNQHTIIAENVNVKVVSVENPLDEDQQSILDATEEAFKNPVIQAKLHENDFQTFDTCKKAIDFCILNKERLNKNERFAIINCSEFEFKFTVIKTVLQNDLPDIFTKKENHIIGYIDSDGTFFPEYDKMMANFLWNNINIDADYFNDDSSLVSDLRVDSLDIIEMIMGFEFYFGIEISQELENRIFSSKTIGEMKKLLTDNILKETS